MKKFSLIFIFLFLFLSATFVSAQIDVEDTPDPSNFNDQPRPQSRISLLRELGLSREQIQQVRLINQERRPKMQAAVRRHMLAKQKLDESVYSDSADDTVIQSNLREAIEAQAEIIKLRTQSELAIRNVLTPEQLIKFREIRRNFVERRNQRQPARKRNLNRRKPGQNRKP